MKLNGTNMSPNESSFEDLEEDLAGREGALLRALITAENKFGPTSGEVGLILMAMIEHFKDDPGKAESVNAYSNRIEEILAIYLDDQKSG